MKTDYTLSTRPSAIMTAYKRRSRTPTQKNRLISRWHIRQREHYSSRFSIQTYNAAKRRRNLLISMPQSFIKIIETFLYAGVRLLSILQREKASQLVINCRGEILI